jgi:hypothetical protein
MKLSLLSVLMAVLLAVSFSSYTDDTKKELPATVGLVGTWTLPSADVVTNDQSLEEFIADLTALLNVSEETVAEKFDTSDFEASTTIAFAEDSTYTLTEAGDDDPGTDKKTATDKTVTVSDASSNEPLTLDVRSLTSSRAVFYLLPEDTDGDMTMKMEVTMNFTK